jgi:N-acetylneuraminate synthase
VDFTKLTKPYLIAEIGINHNGDMNIAKKLINAAAACGWDCAKFQKRNPDVCVPEHQKEVMKDTPWGRMTYLEYKWRVEFGIEAYNEIHAHAWEAADIDWTVSVWDRDSLEEMVTRFRDLPFIKIPSAFMTDLELIHLVIDWDVPVIVSTGMSTLEEVDKTVNYLHKHSDPSKFAIMHCNSSYPADPSELNLKCIPEFKERYGCTIGYSGHEFGLTGSVAAVAMGAMIIERHVTLDRRMWGTDQSSSVEIPGMAKLQRQIEELWLMLGDGKKKLYESEMPSRKKLRGE